MPCAIEYFLKVCLTEIQDIFLTGVYTQSPRVSVHEYETIWNCMEMPSEQTDMETKICTHSVTIRDQIKTKPQKSVDLEGNISSYGKKIIF